MASFSDTKYRLDNLCRSVEVKKEVDNYIERGNTIVSNPPQSLKDLDNVI